MYCSFVKHLEISRSEDWFLDFSSHDQIPALAPPGQGLFPNLLSSTFKVPDYEIESAEQLSWISELVSPSLQAFHISHKYGADLGRVSETLQARDFVLGILAKCCPGLRSLGLLIVPYYNPYPYDLDNSWLPYVSSLTAIRDFSTSPMYTRAEGLEVLRSLPVLESLTITFSDADSDKIIITEAPSCLVFPALRSLSLYHIPSPGALARIWNLSGMVAGLTSLNITSSFKSLERAANFLAEGPSCLASIFSRQESHIQNLSLGHAEESLSWLVRSNFAALLHSVSAFPLRSLKIHVQESWGFDVDSSSDQLCQVVLPSLQQLELFNIRVDFEGLRVFAQSMPNLEYLRAQVLIESIHSLRASDLLVQPRSSTFSILEIDLVDSTLGLLNTRIFTRELNSEDGIKISAFLAALWPNAQIITNPDQRWFTTKQELELQRTRNIIKLLNRQIFSFALRSRETGLPVGELGASDCIITEETWGSVATSVN